MSPFCSRGIGLFIGVDLIKDEATREPATEEANYMVSRYFLLETSCLCSFQGPDWEGAPHPPPPRSLLSSPCSWALGAHTGLPEGVGSWA